MKFNDDLDLHYKIKRNCKAYQKRYFMIVIGGFHTALFEVNLLMTDSRKKTRNYKRQ